MTRVSARWRKSSYSDNCGSSGGCVETAALADGRIAVRDSKAPGMGMLLFTRTGMDAWLDGVKAGEFDTRA